MARQESPKEDLLREATALVERVELAPISGPQGVSVTAGFRPDGAASIFFGADPVYQFNAAGELRRAYCDGLLLKADHGRLVSLRRERRQNEVQLLRHELTDAEQRAFLTRVQSLLSGLATSLQHGEYALVGQVPANADVVGRLTKWLASRDKAVVAATPHAKSSEK
jgi:hypothetical protein